MRTPAVAFVILVLFWACTTTAQPRYKERFSTDPGKDLERVSLKGKIEKVTGQKATLKTESGQSVTVHLGPEHYWRQKGYHLESGTDVTVDGWGELCEGEGSFVFAGGIYGDGFYFELSDTHGYPRWADPWDDDAGWYPRLDMYWSYYDVPPWWWGPPPGYWGPPPWWWRHGPPPHHRHHDDPRWHYQH